MEQLQDINRKQSEIISAQARTIEELRGTIVELNASLAWLKRKVFGKMRSFFDDIKIAKSYKKNKPSSCLFTTVYQCFFKLESRLCLPLLTSSLMPSTITTRSLQVMG